MRQKQMLGPYVLHDEIARGGQGVVYRAVHSQLGNWVAIKVLLDPSGGELKRFRQEAKVLARLNHPNVLKVVDMGIAAGPMGEFPYIAMEYIEGPDLKDLLRDGYPAHKAAQNLISVAEALDYCHQMGITHRDLKPANIVIEEETGRPVIIDFGLVKRDIGKMGLAILDQSRLSLTGEVKGTPQYMAPEQLDSGGDFGVEGPMVDVYALGGILYYILTGRTPFQGATAYNIMVKVMRDEAEDPRETDPDIPAGLAELSLAALSKDPGDRPGSAAIFAETLREALIKRKKKRGIAKRGSRKSGRRKRHRSRLIPGLIAGGLLAAGVGGYSYSVRQARIEKQQLARIEASRIAAEERRIAEAERYRLDAELELEARISEARREEAARVRREMSQDSASPDLEREAKLNRLMVSVRIFEESVEVWDRGNRIEAMEMINRALKLWPENAMALVQRSKFSAAINDKPSALRDINKAIFIYEMAIRTQNMDISDPKIAEARALRSQFSQRRFRRYYR